MVVEPIHGGQEVQRSQSIKARDAAKLDEASRTTTSDSVEISGSAKAAAETKSAIDVVQSVPDLARKQKVEAARERILGGEYLSPKVVDEIAEKIAALLIK